MYYTIRSFKNQTQELDMLNEADGVINKKNTTTNPKNYLYCYEHDIFYNKQLEKQKTSQFISACPICKKEILMTTVSVIAKKPRDKKLTHSQKNKKPLIGLKRNNKPAFPKKKFLG